MTEVTSLQRAFELARLGQLASLDAIRDALRREGFRDSDEALSGEYIRAQLSRVIQLASHLRAV